MVTKIISNEFRVVAYHTKALQLTYSHTHLYFLMYAGLSLAIPNAIQKTISNRIPNSIQDWLRGPKNDSKRNSELNSR